MSTIKLQQRLLKLIHVHDSQTDFLKGRNVNDNIQTIFEVLDYVEGKNIPGVIFFSDFEKKPLTV